MQDKTLTEIQEFCKSIKSSPSFFENIKTLLPAFWVDKVSCHEGHQQVHFLRPKSSDPQGVLILTHAAGKSAFYCFEDLVLAALRKKWLVCAIDLPGHGAFSTTPLKIERYEADLLRIADHISFVLDDQNLVAPRIGVGQSFGALSLLKMCEKRTGFCTELFLVSPALKMGPIFLWFVEGVILFDLHFWGRLKKWGVGYFWRSIGPFRRRHYPLRIPLGSRLRFVTMLFQKLQVDPSALDISLHIAYGKRDFLVSQKDIHHFCQQKSIQPLRTNKTHFGMLCSFSMVSWLSESKIF